MPMRSRCTRSDADRRFVSSAWTRSGRALASLLFLLVGFVASPIQSADPNPPLPEDATQVRPLGVGERLPRASIRTIDGADVDLAGLAAESGALLVFYRGGW